MKKLFFFGLVYFVFINFLIAQSNLIVSPTAEAAWSSISCPVTATLNCVTNLNSSQWYAGGEGAVIGTSTSKDIWRNTNYPFGFHVINGLASYIENGKTYLFGVAQGGRLIKSTNGGSNWTEYYPYTIISTADFKCLFHYYDSATGKHHLWVAGTNSTIMRTTDNGATWYNQSLPVSGLIINDVYFYNSNLGFVIASNGNILVTTNGGTTWNLAMSGTSQTLTGTAIIDATKGFAVGNNGTILRTLNGGNTWTSVVSNVTTNLTEIAFLNSVTGYVVGAGGTILVTNDGGATWQRSESNSTKDLNDIYIDPPTQTVIIVGQTGTILTNSVRYTLTTGVSPNEASQEGCSVSVNPNQSNYDSGTSVTLTAVASANWEFQEWNGGLSGSINPQSITMYSDKSVTAIFRRKVVKVSLTSSVYPLDAAEDGSTVSPSGINLFDKNTEVTMDAAAGGGWVWKEWSGALAGDKKPQKLIMDMDKNVVANFQPILVLSLTSPSENAICPPNPSEEITIATAGVFVDGVDWQLNAISFGVVEKFKPDFTEAWIEYLGKKLKGTIALDSEGFANSLSFTPNQKIEEGTTLSVRLFLKFNFPSTSADKYIPNALTEVKRYKVSIHVGQVNCVPIPESARPGVKTPVYPPTIFYSNTQTLASVWNISKDPDLPFATIKEAVQSTLTSSGDVIELCDGIYQENVDIVKSLSIKSKQGKDYTFVKPSDKNDNIFEIKSDEVKIEGLTLSGADASVKAAIFADHSISSSAVIKKLEVTLCDIYGSWWGIFVQGPESTSNVSSQIFVDQCNIHNNLNDGICTTGWRLLLTVENSVINYNKNGIKCGDIVNITNCKIKFNKEDGIFAEGNIGILNENSFNSEISENDFSGINAGSHSLKVSIKSLENSSLQINNNGRYGIIAPHSNVTANNIELSLNGRLDSQLGYGIYAGDVDFMNVKINKNRADGIYAIFGLGVQADEKNISEVSNNDGTGISVGGGATKAVVRGLENGKVLIHNNGAEGIWTRNANFRGENFEIFGSGRVLPERGVGLTAFDVDVMNAKIKYNKSHGIYCSGSVGVQAADGFISEISYNDGIGVYSGRAGFVFTLRGLESSTVVILSNGLEGVVSDVAEVYGRNLRISGNGRINNKEGIGLHARGVDLANSTIDNNKADGIVCSQINFLNGSVKSNNGWGIIINGKASLSKIQEGVSLIGNNSGAIWFRQPMSKTGYLLNNQLDNSAVISGSMISNNKGDGIKNDASESFQIRNTNIFNNSGFGINNLNPQAILTATNNYWGSSSGPSGSGNGTGDKVSSNVSFSNWLGNPISVIISSSTDTLKSIKSSSDTLNIGFYNFIKVPDKLNVTVTDSLGWVTSSKNFSVDISDTNFVFKPLIISTPSNASNEKNKIRISAVSNSNSGQQYQKSITQNVYSQQAVKINISPANAIVAQNKEKQFTSVILDQLGKSMSNIPTWSAVKGSISAQGLYTAPNDTGRYTISAKSGNVQTSVLVRVVSTEPFLQNIHIYPDSVYINPNQSYQFFAAGFNQFDSMHVFTPAWTATGGSIDQTGKYIAGLTKGIFKVTAASGTIKDDAIVNVGVIVNIKEEIIPAAYSLSQNFPNPFNPSTLINYALPKRSKVKLTIFDILGRMVATLVNEVKEAGKYEVKFNASKLSSGVYFYQLRADDYLVTKKMLLVK